MRRNKAMNMITCKGNPETEKDDTVVIKPRPRIFRKTLGWHSYGETPIPNHNVQLVSNKAEPSKVKIISPPADINGRETPLLEDNQTNYQRNTIEGACLGDHGDEDHELFTGFFPQVNDDPAGTSCCPGDIFFHGSPSFWCDFSGDVDLWNLFSTELEAPATSQNRSC
ncbi:hypothetical protein Tsubulata_033083 [Turnera subulata]|uniref:Uncharacterized protein n=1 Tax=Turnera subulata TaxID=218843 RepID=A0A9Q0J262_9ROSI|nr:hypothetical protein Tsubulata_033083 [Turnera subulata]